MLTGMSRLALFSLLFVAACAGCSRSAGNQDKVSASPPGGAGQKIAVPTGDQAQKIPVPSASGAAPVQPVDDPHFHLQPQEGTLEVDPAQGQAGSEVTGAVKVTPATGYHVATDYPIKLTLEAPAGVTLAKPELTAGGRDKAQGDAVALSEKGLAFDVKATAAKPGAYQIKGWFKFGVCDQQSCHPKKQPITIALGAK
jgi:hypothetical protein